MRNIFGIFVLIIALSVNAWTDPNELKVGSTYQVSRDTPLMSATTSSISSIENLKGALSKSHKILKGSQFTVLNIKSNKDGYPDWYRVDAGGVMDGWVKVIALYGQDLVDVNAVDNPKRVWLHDREGVKYEALYTFEETDYKCVSGYTDLCDSSPQLNEDEAYLESDGWLEGYYEIKEYNLKMHKGDVVVRITDRGTKKAGFTLDVPIEVAPESVTAVKDKLAVEPAVMGEDAYGDNLWKGEEVSKKIEFDSYIAKQKSIEIELNSINAKISELRGANKTRVEKLVTSLEKSSKALLEAANKAQDERSMWNSAKENIEIYSEYLGSSETAKNALLFYKKMFVLNKKMESYGDNLSLRDAETILRRAALGKSAKDGDLPKAILMYGLEHSDLVIVAKDYLTESFLK